MDKRMLLCIDKISNFNAFYKDFCKVRDYYNSICTGNTVMSKIDTSSRFVHMANILINCHLKLSVPEQKVWQVCRYLFEYESYITNKAKELKIEA